MGGDSFSCISTLLGLKQTGNNVQWRYKSGVLCRLEELFRQMHDAFAGKGFFHAGHGALL